MRVAAGNVAYDWIEPWAEPPDPKITATAWPHPAIVSGLEERLSAFHPARTEVVTFDHRGRIRSAFPVPVAEATA